MGIPDHLTCLLRNLYAGQEATIRTGHGTTDCFQIGKGVCQGCILSPCLFNLYAEYWRRKCQPTPVFLPGESHGWRSLVGYSPRGRKESDTTERLHFHFHNGLQNTMNITFICLGKPKNPCDSLYCDICFIVMIWNCSHSIS